jgi:hypothetical protein
MAMKSHNVIILASLMLLAGCASGPTIQSPEAPVAYTPVASPTRIGGSATIEASYDPAPEMQAAWRRMGFSDAVIEQHRKEVAGALVNDLATSGLFSRVVSASAGVHPDHIVRIHCTTSDAPGYTSLEVSLKILNGATGRQEWALSSATGLGPITGPHRPLSGALPQIMAHLRANLADAMAMKAREDAEAAEIASLKTASLTDLLIASDRNTTIARDRNRAIIAAKDLQLPSILRDWKTDQLSALVVKIEQTILDLDHECELAKDKAQQSVADGTSPNGLAEVQRAAVEAVAQRRGGGRGAPAAPQGFLGIAMVDAAGGGGVAVQSVVPGGPAARAGLKPADIISDMDGQPMPTAQALQSGIARTAPGSSVRLRIMRDGAEQLVAVVIGARPEGAPNSVGALRDLSISFRERIELLKPIAAAIKEEIANRNR